jgi:hypothetical protein
MLANLDLGVIKCVAADYDTAACVPKKSRFGPHRYFGWLRMSSGHVLSLWFGLDIYSFGEIGNCTAGGLAYFGIQKNAYTLCQNFSVVKWAILNEVVNK